MNYVIGLEFLSSILDEWYVLATLKVSLVIIEIVDLSLC